MSCTDGLPRLRLVGPAEPSAASASAAGPAAHPPHADADTDAHAGPGTDGHADGSEHGRADAPAGTADGPSQEVASLPPLALESRPATAGQRSAEMARHWLRLALAGAWRRLTRPGGVWHEQPPSLAHHHAYYQSRAWVPDGHEGPLLPLAGQAYGYTIGMAGLVVGHGVAWVLARPLRLGLALLVAGGITAAVLLG